MTRFLHKLPSMAAAAAAGAFLTLAAPSPASAQFFYYGFASPFHRPLFYRPPVYYPPVVAEELSPGEIVAAVRSRGFQDVSRPVYREDTAIMTATGRDGRRARLAVDIYSGRILDAAPLQRQRMAQRAPDQGAAVRRAVPDNRRDVRGAPEAAPAARPPTSVRREPMLPPQPQQATPPRTQPPAARQPLPPQAQPPTAQQNQPGTRAQPRRIDITPPAALDDARPPAPPPPSGPPINSVPPAALE